MTCRQSSHATLRERRATQQAAASAPRPISDSDLRCNARSERIAACASVAAMRCRDRYAGTACYRHVRAVIRSHPAPLHRPS